jgi:hypothetical protein
MIDPGEGVKSKVAVSASGCFLALLCRYLSMFRVSVTRMVAIQRWLIAAIVWLAPLCSDLPCCCQRATASISDNSETKPTQRSCCKKISQTSTPQKKSCCHVPEKSPTDRPADSERTDCCSCCVDDSIPVVAISRESKMATRIFVGHVEVPMLFASVKPPQATLAVVARSKFSIPPDEHNRHQAVLCVWRN